MDSSSGQHSLVSAIAVAFCIDASGIRAGAARQETDLFWS
jgi:hypothetical protein